MIGFTGLFDELAAAHGPQRDWWPAESAFEVMLGAILVQRTAWRNAARAIDELRQQALLDPASLAAADPEIVARLIRSAGFFRAKSARLCVLAAFVLRSGGVAALDGWDTSRLRACLLELNGVGPETADAMLLYAFARPVVVVDEYLRRLLGRLGPPFAGLGDDGLRRAVLVAIGDAPRLREFHALVVEHGKGHCTTRPRCGDCPLRRGCQLGGGRLSPGLPGACP